ncbi:MAG TPA: hypothetical protein VK473_00445 [Terriglobales bacterium]|nr:hypothetical protein [Terriglobales bacterium]
MTRKCLILIFMGLCSVFSAAASKPHVVALGKWTTATFFLGSEEDTTVNIRIRPLIVDGKTREFTTGDFHDVTDRTFVVRRAYRLNDTLPADPPNAANRWRWQRGGWVLVDRVTGKVSQLNLPEFDPFYSEASWYRDYVAYCGVSDDGEKLYAMVAQLGRRKPLLKKALGQAQGGDTPESECTLPGWQRRPTRVTFSPAGKAKLTFEVWGRSVDLANEAEADE